MGTGHEDCFDNAGARQPRETARLAETHTRCMRKKDAGWMFLLLLLLALRGSHCVDATLWGASGVKRRWDDTEKEVVAVKGITISGL